MATYELVTPGTGGQVVQVVTDLPTLEVGAVIFGDGVFWRVERIEAAAGSGADGRAVLVPTSGTPR